MHSKQRIALQADLVNCEHAVKFNAIELIPGLFSIDSSDLVIGISPL
jgi:hypothetical protein